MVLTCRILPISGWKEETFAWTGPFHHGLFFFEFDTKRIFHVQSNGSPRDWTAVEGEECKVTTVGGNTYSRKCTLGDNSLSIRLSIRIVGLSFVMKCQIRPPQLQRHNHQAFRRETPYNNPSPDWLLLPCT